MVGQSNRRGNRRRRGGGAGRKQPVRNTKQNKVVMLRRRPRRNVPVRLPTLGYAAGGTSTTVRAFIKDFTLLANTKSLADTFAFTLKDALANTASYAKTFSTVYTNFQLHRITFRVISMQGSNVGGNHGILVMDDSMGFPAASDVSYADLISRGGSTGGKLWTDLATEWVPTEPEDYNYRDSQTKELALYYAAELPANLTTATVLCKLVADIHLTARTFNTATPTTLAEMRAVLNDMESKMTNPASLHPVPHRSIASNTLRDRLSRVQD